MDTTSRGAELGGESTCLELLLHLCLSVRLILRLTVGLFSEMRLWMYRKHQIQLVMRINDKPTKAIPWKAQEENISRREGWLMA